MTIKKYEFLEHPADIKIRSYGKDLNELFVNSALGMMEFLYGTEIPQGQILATDYETIEIHAEDLDSLFVSWLAEILYSSEVNYRACVEYRILEIDEKHVVAEVGSGKAQAKDDIKAVTYHDLKIEKTLDGWVATVVYDI
jgi:SHS2 domain-containing protein